MSITDTVARTPSKFNAVAFLNNMVAGFAVLFAFTVIGGGGNLVRITVQNAALFAFGFLLFSMGLKLCSNLPIVPDKWSSRLLNIISNLLLAIAVVLFAWQFQQLMDAVPA